MKLLDKLKQSEDAGFKTEGKPYKDHLGYNTIGYGTKLPLSEYECTLLLQHRLDKLSNELYKAVPLVVELSEARQEVLYEMAYQMGVPRTLKFKKMWAALAVEKYNEAAAEMLDSRWAIQTPDRARRLADIMRSGE